MPSFTKTLLPHEKFYISAYSKKNLHSYLLFIHGGPGLNCAVLENLIEHHDYFETLNFNIIFYDQRGCGRSVAYFDSQSEYSHHQNISDLNEIYDFLSKEKSLMIIGFIGHSYGAKLLSDFYQFSSVNLPGIFVSTAFDIITPRLNNLMLDIAYMKKSNPDKYQQLFSTFDMSNYAKIWELTEELAPLFEQNKERRFLYWANLAIMQMIFQIQEKINLPIINKVFMDIRRDLYASQQNQKVLIKELDCPSLWINGSQDSIMGEPMQGLSNSKITLFSKSAHYPHIEENTLFCETINKFLKNK